MKNIITGMGVINLTPNSFSDGGKYNQSHLARELIKKMLQEGASCLDFGAESTAPSSDPVSEETEKQRFKEILFPILREIPPQIKISIDTYRGNTFKFVYEFIKCSLMTNEIIWNDVSGVLDQELLNTLKNCPEASYIYSHTHVPSREKTSFHMDYIGSSSTSNLIKYFKGAVDFFVKNSVDNNILLDPCFGFSKTKEQSIALFKDLHTLIDYFPTYAWVIGISKKSFLKAQLGKAQSLESLHVQYLSELFSRLSGKNLYIRLHDPKILVHNY